MVKIDIIKKITDYGNHDLEKQRLPWNHCNQTAQVPIWHTHVELCPPSSPSHNFTQIMLHVMKSYFISQPGDPGQVLGFSLPTKSVQGEAELGFYRISSQSRAQSSSLQETRPWAQHQCPFEGITHINGVMRVKSHVIYTLKGESNAWKNQFG